MNTDKAEISLGFACRAFGTDAFHPRLKLGIQCGGFKIYVFDT
jgi:hypothetical protein